MEFFELEKGERAPMCRNGAKNKRKMRRRMVSAMLCVLLLATNTVGALAVEDIAATPAPDGGGSAEETPAQGSPLPSEGESQPSPTCVHQHTEACDPALGAVCTHVCTVESGCIPPQTQRIEEWTWVDEEEFLTQYDGAWYLSLPGADSEDVTQELLEEMLPREILAALSDGTEVRLPITWTFPASFDGAAEQPCRLDAAVGGDCSLADGVQPPYVLFTFGGAEVYANYPGTREPRPSDAPVTAHVVEGITPAGTTINLFDYDAGIGSDGNDLLPPVAKFENYSTLINKDALLLFGGSSMREAGFWNQGAGAGRPWGKTHRGMEGIVKSTLVGDYPYINLDEARSLLKDATNTPADDWGAGVFMDVANLNHAEFEDAGVDKARALSVKLLRDRGLTVDETTGVVTGDCAKASLRYLFDPETETDGKMSYKNVTGLFQVDEEGYYYYDARKNFAEFNPNADGTTTKDGMPSDGSFTLYDGPAVWRTDAGYNPDTNAFDGDMSLGNFFPFDRAEHLFDCIQTEDKDKKPTNILSCSEDKTNVSNKVLANHYLGMTMTVKFAQPEDGKLNMGSSGKQPMIFQFSGDDDVWIFIDDVLVMDLGGIHSELYGTIDFSTGKVVTGQSWRTGGLPSNPGDMPGDATTTLYDLFVAALGQEETDKLHWVTKENGDKIFPTGTEHELKLFYLERGNYDSSLQMRFTLQSPLYHSIKKVDQNGDPLQGVEFELYKATATNGNSSNVDDYTYTPDDLIGTMTTGADGKSTFTRADGSPFSFTDQYHADGTIYYILKETQTAGGYRALPVDIVLRFETDMSMLVVANRYQTGAYASFFSNIREAGQLTYGQFDTISGVIAPSNTELEQGAKQQGLIIAVPMLLQSGMSYESEESSNGGRWLAVYGSNTEGYGTVAPAERTAPAWREAVLKAALYQASDERWPGWHLTYNEDTGKLEGLLEDLPGRSDRYALNNANGDMKMVYGIIQPSALKKLGITGSTSAERYHALEDYVSKAVKDGAADGKSTEEVINEIAGKLNVTGDSFSDREFSFLNTDQFQREFRSTIYIPNERRELRVQKVDEDGKGVNGAEFTLKSVDGSTTITGTTATVDDQDGMLIFRPDAEENEPGYARAVWGAVGDKYTLEETSAPAGYQKNDTKIPVVVGVYSIYADAGTPEDGVTVMAGVGKLMQTMTKYAADDTVNITLRDITAIAQKQARGSFDPNGWEDDFLAERTSIRSSPRTPAFCGPASSRTQPRWKISCTKAATTPPTGTI